MTIFKANLPSIGVRDGPWFANGNAGCRLIAKTRLAGSAMVSDLLTFLMLYKGHGFFTKNVYFIQSHLKDFYRADLHALAATITLIGVDSDVPVARPILKPVIGNHVISFSPATLME